MIGADYGRGAVEWCNELRRCVEALDAALRADLIAPALIRPVCAALMAAHGALAESRETVAVLCAPWFEVAP